MKCLKRLTATCIYQCLAEPIIDRHSPSVKTSCRMSRCEERLSLGRLWYQDTADENRDSFVDMQMMQGFTRRSCHITKILPLYNLMSVINWLDRVMFMYS